MDRNFYIKKVQNLTNEPNDFQYLTFAVSIAQIDNNVADNIRNASFVGWEDGMTIDETFYNENVSSDNKPTWTDVNAVISELKTAYANKETAQQAQADLKASAKAKLVAGTPLTEEEANILVGV